MAVNNLYQVMGVAQNATDQDIKHAYRRLARKYHPDLNKEKNAEEKFKELGAAYEILKDPARRKHYDQFLAGSTQRPAAGVDAGAYAEDLQDQGFGGFSGNEDLFAFIFGQGHGSANKRQAADSHSAVTISLEDAYQGALQEIQLQASPHLPTSTLKIKIPAGIRDGQKIRLPAQGAQVGQQRGDLYLTIHVAKHALFDVKQDDIYLTLPVTPWEAALGANIAIPTLAGQVDLKIPAGSQGGQTLRLKGKGLPGKIAGNQYVILKIVTPKAETAEDRALYKKMAQAMPLNPRRHMGV